MSVAPLGIRNELLNAGRLPSLSRSASWPSALELSLLILAGITAASITAFWHPQIRVPGSVILRVVFPMVFGLALVPRRSSALIAGGAAGITGTIFALQQVGKISTGELTTLWLIGPMLELAMIKATRGWKLYLRFATAGLATNLITFFIRGIAAGSLTAESKRYGWEMTLLSFVLCGAVAGLVSALVWFRARNNDPTAFAEGPSP